MQHIDFTRNYKSTPNLGISDSFLLGTMVMSSKTSHAKEILVFTIEAHSQLNIKTRQEIDDLIFGVWSRESTHSHDVSVLVSQGESVIDPLDEISHHVVVKNHIDLVVAYGRITIFRDEKMLDLFHDELKIENNVFPVAYISRLVVHPEYRGQGLSVLIHNKRIEIATQNDAKKIFGWAVGDLPRSAIKKAGFVETKLRLGFSTNWYKTSRTTRLVEIDLEHHNNLNKSENISKIELLSVSNH